MIVDSMNQKSFLGGISDVKRFGISSSPIIFQILSSFLYYDKISSIIRELASNARDAHRVKGIDRPFDITVPVENKEFSFSSIENSEFVIRDYGYGLSEDAVYNLYTVYGESDKRSDNECIGGFGIGSKSPFSYTKMFTVISRHDGIKGVYSAFVNSDGYPAITKISSEETDEESGLEIRIPVKREDISKFEEGLSVLEFFNPFPNLNIEYKHWINDKLYESDKCFVTKVTGRGDRRFHILVDCVDYSINPSKIFVKNGWLGNKVHIFLKGNIGDVDLSASREELDYTPKTVNFIQNILNEIRNDIEKEMFEYRDKNSLYETVKYMFDFPLCLSSFGTDKTKELSKTVIQIPLEELKKAMSDRGVTLRIRSFGKFYSLENKDNNIYQNNLVCFNPTFRIDFYAFDDSYNFNDMRNYLKERNIGDAYMFQYKDKKSFEEFLEKIGRPLVIYTERLAEKTENTKKGVTVETYQFHMKKYGTCSDAIISRYHEEHNVDELLDKYPNKKLLIRCSEGRHRVSTAWEHKDKDIFTKIHSQFIRFSYYFSNEELVEFDRILNGMTDVLVVNTGGYKTLQKYGFTPYTIEEILRMYLEAVEKFMMIQCPEVLDEAIYDDVLSRLTGILMAYVPRDIFERNAGKNPIFGFVAKHYDLLGHKGKTILYKLYSKLKIMLDGKTDFTYDKAIESEPIYSLFVTAGYYHVDDVLACLKKYLNIY